MNEENKYSYVELVEDLAKQAFELMPEDVDNDTKIYMKNAIVFYPKHFGDAIAAEDSFISDKDLTNAIQISAEWLYHKMIDLYRSGVSREFWEEIIYGIIDVIFEYVKKRGNNELTSVDYLQKIEDAVITAYDNKLQELLSNNLITEEVYEKTKKHSNIDELAKCCNEQKEDEFETFEELFCKHPFMATIAFLLISALITEIIIKINPLVKYIITNIKNGILLVQTNLPLPLIIKNNLKFILLWLVVFVILLALGKIGSELDKNK